MSIIGIRAGSSGLLIATLVPPNGTLRSGPKFATSNEKVVLQATNDPFAVVAKVAADNTSGSFDLFITGHITSGGINNTISNTFVIPILK